MMDGLGDLPPAQTASGIYVLYEPTEVYNTIVRQPLRTATARHGSRPFILLNFILPLDNEGINFQKQILMAVVGGHFS